MNLLEVEALFREEVESDERTILGSDFSDGYVTLVARNRLPEGGNPTVSSQMRAFELVTNGAEAFISRIDDGFSRIDFEYDAAEQHALVRLLGDLASQYLSGGGELVEHRTWLRRLKTEYVLWNSGTEYRFSTGRVSS